MPCNAAGAQLVIQDSSSSLLSGGMSEDTRTQCACIKSPSVLPSNCLWLPPKPSSYLTSSPPMMWSMMPYSLASMGDMYLTGHTVTESKEWA
jgi:hypothetical protein